MSMTGMTSGPASASGPAFAQTALGLQSRIGENWQLGFRGNLHRVEDPNSTESFGTPAADRIIEALGRRRAGRGEVPVIRRAPTETDLLRLDLQALSTWRDRGRLVREHLFPAPSYMRGKYGVRSPLLLPALYAWRVVAAAPRWLRRRGGPT